ncbi:transmembrane protein 220 isoform X3 [Pelodiscus sinensis]|uniref:transmembrane protein 220 isoform X3 n=1 Tax=Pelodiscus sinensis TaxID=13735 RepID=UPI0003C4AF69|nr:transmembrane protein 220 isoform X2 [Pelodiscus sinensis]|eukprot:XP_006131462.1 transmembrane protein 220 isoform X2 [Pelodiscus sinensis]
MILMQDCGQLDLLYLSNRWSTLYLLSLRCLLALPRQLQRLMRLYLQGPSQAKFGPENKNNVIWRSLSDLHSAACLLGTIALGYSLFTYAKSNILHEEEGRELFGLVIIAVWMRLCRNSAKNPMGGMCLMGAVTLSFFPFVSWLYIYMNSEMRSSWPTHCKTVI